MPPRATSQIGYKGAQTLYYAIGEHADRINLPLTQLVTVNFSHAGVNPQHAVAAFQRLRANYFNKWAVRPGKRGGRPVAPTYAYCFENERDGRAFGKDDADGLHNVHVHWFVHIPASRLHEFECRVQSWVDAVCGYVTPKGTVDVRPIRDAKGLRSYGLKGVDKAWAEHFGANHEDQGTISGGRRSGTSTNLGRAARIGFDRQHGIRRKAA